MNSFLKITIAIFFSIFMSAAAFAQRSNQSVTVSNVQPGSSAVVSWTDANGNPAQQTRFDINRDGKIEFYIPSSVKCVTITKIDADSGQSESYDKKLKSNAVTVTPASPTQL